MKMAATRALAELARQDVPESVEQAYGDERFRFGADYLIPKPFDPRIMLWVAPAVARRRWRPASRACRSTWTQYRAELDRAAGPRPRGDARHHAPRAPGPARASCSPRARTSGSSAPRAWCWRKGSPGRSCSAAPEVIRERARDAGRLLEGVEIVDPGADDERPERYAQEFYAARQRKGVTLAEARERMREPIYFGCMMVLRGRCGRAAGGRGHVLPRDHPPRAADIGTAPGVTRVAGLYMMVLENELALLRRHHREHRPGRRDARRDRGAGGATSCGGWASSRGWRCSRSPTSARCAARRATRCAAPRSW